MQALSRRRCRAPIETSGDILLAARYLLATVDYLLRAPYYEVLDAKRGVGVRVLALLATRPLTRCWSPRETSAPLLVVLWGSSDLSNSPPPPPSAASLSAQEGSNRRSGLARRD